MSIERRPGPDLALRMTNAEGKLVDIRKDLDQHTKLLIGDPETRQEGLMFVVADLSKLISAQAELVTLSKRDMMNQLSSHIESGHTDRRSESWGRRLGYEAVRQVVVSMILIIMALLALGVITFVRNGGHL